MKPARQLAAEGPSTRDIELYYFVFEEVLDMLKCCESELRARISNPQFGAIYWRGKWHVPPGSIPLLREYLWGIR